MIKTLYQQNDRKTSFKKCIGYNLGYIYCTIRLKYGKQSSLYYIGRDLIAYVIYQ